MPDKVLITTQASEASMPKSLYCNLQTERFFGCNFVSRQKPPRPTGDGSDNSDDSDEEQQPEIWRGKVMRKKDPSERRIFQDCQVVDFCQVVSKGIQVDQASGLSLNEVIARQSIERKSHKATGAAGESLTRCYLVQSPNRYEASENAMKVVQVNVLDIFFDEQICSLTYIHDITHLFQKE